MAVREGEPLVCRACQDKTYAFERARSFGIYDGALVRAILLLKWERIEPLGVWFAERLAEVANRKIGLLAADVVVPVPCMGIASGSGEITKRGLFPSRWRGSWAYLIGRCCLCGRGRVLANRCSVWRSGGSRFVALLPHVQAAKLTISASYW